jgi:hypothetical protein
MATATMTKAPAMTSISEKAVFLSIHFERFGNTRKVATSQVEVDADKTQVRVSKRLLQSESLLQIRRLDHEARAFVEARCLPFEKGIHVLPLGLVEEVDAELREFETRRAVLIDSFVEEYPTLLEGARTVLRSLFNSRDYATQDQARAEFRMRWNYLSLSTPEKLAELSPSMFADERRKIEEKMNESYQEWRAILRVAMADLVKRLSESLQPTADGKTRKLTDASVTKLQDFLQTFSFRNVTDDGELAKICEQVKKIMSGVTVERLRESESLKENTGKAIAKAVETLEVMTAGIRKFRDDDED